MRVKEQAWGKVNYFLSVGGAYGNGYHAIETLMQTISLHDIVTVEVEEGDGISLIITNDDTLPTDESNLAYRAALVFLQHLGRPLRIRIEIEKHIPIAGGLAGGSADAAAVLRGINKCIGNIYSLRELAEMANEFGSDIAFCVYGGLALCKGRGEMVYPLPRTRNLHFLIANSGEKVSTREAYTLLDTRPSKIEVIGSFDCAKALWFGEMEDIATASLNSFEEVVLPTCPETLKILSEMKEFVPFAQMSGSGPTIFAVFDSRNKALSLQEKLSFETIYAHTIFPREED